MPPASPRFEPHTELTRLFKLDYFWLKIFSLRFRLKSFFHTHLGVSNTMVKFQVCQAAGCCKSQYCYFYSSEVFNRSAPSEHMKSLTKNFSPNILIEIVFQTHLRVQNTTVKFQVCEEGFQGFKVFNRYVACKNQQFWIENFMTYILTGICFRTHLRFPPNMDKFQVNEAASYTETTIIKVLKFSTGSHLVKIGNF